MPRKLRNEELNRLTVEKFKKAAKTPLVLVLDNIRSMNNVGSIFRTADAFKLSHIHLCGITACPPHREIRKTALGAEESVDWTYWEQTTDALRFLKDHHIYALEQTTDSSSLRSFQHTGAPLALIVGNEVDGVAPDLLHLCRGSIEIPQFGTKHSFNVAVSAGIAMWELFNKINESQ